MFFALVLSASVFLELHCQRYDYKEAYVDSRIDHFNFQTLGGRTFKQRYIYNDTWWEKGRGPIFFYAGNEYPIDVFWENSGFIMEIAQSYNAMILFAEHRFYGKSLPFGQDSLKNPAISWCSISQAIADYAFLLRKVKKEFKAENCPVVAFGGSYGGLLAVYMRFKYPNIIVGSLAASSPIYLAADKVPNKLYSAVTKHFREASPNCESQVRGAFRQLDELAGTGQSGLNQISQTFRLCNPLKSNADYDHLLRWARGAFALTAMMNYPYSTEFVGKFPAFPVKVMCERLAAEQNLATGLSSACGLYFNASGDLKCFDIYKDYKYCADTTGCVYGEAWDYQVCTEINLEASSNGVDDMFPVLPFNSSMRDEYCRKRWNVLPRRNWLDVVMWGKDLSSSSNIVFSDGDLDPYAPGGVQGNITDSIVHVLIEGGAHHLDLRASNPADPESVKKAREFEKRNIDKWLREYNKGRQST